MKLMGSRIVIESVCGERGGILLGLHGVRVHAEKETIFFLFPNDWEIPTDASHFISRRWLRLLNTDNTLVWVSWAG